MPKDTNKTPMVNKIEVKSSKEEGMFSMIMGTIIVAIGILIFVSGVVLLVLYNLPPKEDANLVTPVVIQLPQNSNQKEIDIKGTSQYSKVMVWVNNSVVSKSVSVKNGSFEYVYKMDKEGSYKVEVAGINGFPLRHRSVKSNAQTVVLDFTAPSSNISLSYVKNTDKKTLTISGTAEANVNVIFSKDSKEYSAQTDSSGKFSIKDIALASGKNEFSISLKDLAGNTTRVDQTVSVVYAAGNLDGNGTSTKLPESAGNLSDAKEFLMQNKLMSLFGIVALFALISSSALVIVKGRKEQF